MRVCIHRGAREIGGNCVELESGRKRLLIDIGRPLDASRNDEADLPRIAGLTGQGDGSLLGIVLSHPHQDHYGLVEYVDPSIPVFIGDAAARILDAAAFFAPSGIRIQPRGFLSDRRPLEIGPFTLTPYLMDHSAFDSYALLIETGGRRLLYTGDFRAHGRKAALTARLRDHPPKNVDVVLLEGTHIRARGQMPAGPDEAGVESAMADLLRQTRGLAVIFSATQNIDRLVTTYRACKKAGRTLVIDLYTATVAAATRRDTIPQPGFPRLRVHVPNRQRILVKTSAEFGRIESIRKHRIFLDEVRSDPGKFVFLAQGSTLPELARAGCLADASAIWSLWPGYLDQPSGARVTRVLEQHAVPLLQLHSSGHASIEDLQRLALAINPNRIVPIHTSAPTRFPELFKRVELRQDGEWWPV